MKSRSLGDGRRCVETPRAARVGVGSDHRKTPIGAVATPKYVQVDLPAGPALRPACCCAGALARVRGERGGGVGVVGELVANAVLHGTPPISLSATPHATGLRVRGPRPPNQISVLLFLTREACSWSKSSPCSGASIPTPDGKVVRAVLPL